MKGISMIRCLGLISALLSLAVVSSAADTAAEARKQIQASYNRENAAAVRKDTSGVVANMTSDYTSTDLRGQKVTVEQIRQALPSMFASAVSIKARSKITGLTLKGTQADVVVNEHAEIVLVNPRTRKRSKLVVDEVYQTLWVKADGAWKKKRSKTLSSKQLLDGKRARQPI